MTDLRTAAQQALEALEYRDGDGADQWKADVITALRAALAEPVLNPATGYCKHCKQYTIEEPLPAEPVQEPVAWMVYTLDGKSVCVTDNPADFTDEHKVLPLYAAPSQRKPLTQEKIWHIYKNLWMFHPAEEPRLAGDVLKFARAIERAHGIWSEA